jgi:hypothetical protein
VEVLQFTRHSQRFLFTLSVKYKISNDSGICSE